jgi:nitroreductase|tara:strand:- start:879 stop:1595 length:717 start_codon:yes stop_codon:yes gene_type:complete
MNESEQNQLVQAIKTSAQCQRNWDLDKKIPQEHLDIIETALTRCPSKQSRADYVPYMITNKELIHRIYENTDGFVTDHTVSPPTTTTNPQVCANLLIALITAPERDKEWMSRYGKDNTSEIMSSGHPLGEKEGEKEDRRLGLKKLENKNTLLNVGVAMGYVVLVANQLGYKTGICNCLDGGEVKKLLGIKSNDAGLPEVLGLIGIGYADETKDRKQHMFNNYVFPSYSEEKNIEVKKL